MKKTKTNLQLQVAAPIVAVVAALAIAVLWHAPAVPFNLVIFIGAMVPLMFYVHIRRIEQCWRESDRRQKIQVAHRKFAEAQLTEAKEEIESAFAELYRVQEKLQLHIQQTPLGMIQWSTDFTVEGWNPAAEAIFGYTAAEAIGRTANQLIVPKDLRLSIDQVCSDLLTATESSVNQNENVTRDGTRIMCLWHNTPLVDAAGEVIGASSIVEDITLKQQYERSLEEARDRAEAANRAKSQFLANMTHELRTPMNAIMGFSDLLRDELLSAEQQDYIETIRTSSRHLLQLINDILDLSKMEAGKEQITLGVCALREMLGQLEGLMLNEARRKNLQFELCIRPDVPHQVICDGKHIYQCLINLVGNAIKFTEEGTVSLYVGTVDSSDQPTLYFEVTDTGIGIPKDRREAIFKSFEQADTGTSRRYGGTGLGLAITAELVEMMDGTLTLESQVNVGSTFTITLPFEPAPAPIATA